MSSITIERKITQSFDDPVIEIKYNVLEKTTSCVLQFTCKCCNGYGCRGKVCDNFINLNEINVLGDLSEDIKNNIISSLNTIFK